MNRSLCVAIFFASFAFSSLTADAAQTSYGQARTQSLSCEVEDQGGQVDANCGYETPIRCYANIRFEDGSTATVYGSQCWDNLGDCNSIGAGRVDPCN